MLLMNTSWNLLLWSCPVFCGVSFTAPSNEFSVTRMMENHFWDWCTGEYWIRVYVASVMDLLVLRKNQWQSRKLSCREIHVEKGSVCPPKVTGGRRSEGLRLPHIPLGELSLNNSKINDLWSVSAPVRSWGDEYKLKKGSDYSLLRHTKSEDFSPDPDSQTQWGHVCSCFKSLTLSIMYYKFKDNHDNSHNKNCYDSFHSFYINILFKVHYLISSSRNDRMSTFS